MRGLSHFFIISTVNLAFIIMDKVLLKANREVSRAKCREHHRRILPNNRPLIQMRCIVVPGQSQREVRMSNETMSRPAVFSDSGNLDASEKAAAKSAPGGKVDAPNWITPGASRSPLHTKKDVDGLQYSDTLPGLRLVRGPQATTYAAAQAIRQYAGPPDFQTAVPPFAAGGQSPRYRSTTWQRRRTRYRLGRQGWWLIRGRFLSDGILLDKICPMMTMNESRAVDFAGYVVAAEEQGVTQTSSRGPSRTTSSKEFMVRNTYLSAEAVGKIIADIFGYTAQHMPVQLDLDSGYHIQEAGANQAIELAFTLADGMEYVRTGVASAWTSTPSPVACRSWAVGMNFTSRSPKMRAAACCGSASSQFNAKNPKSMMLRTHSQTSGWSLTEQDPYNNVVRRRLKRCIWSSVAPSRCTPTRSTKPSRCRPSSPAHARNTQLIIQKRRTSPTSSIRGAGS